MTTMGLGAAKRHEINETVRLRMAALLPTGGGAVVGDGAGAEAGAGVGAGAGGPVGSGAAMGALASTGPPSGAVPAGAGERPPSAGPAPPVPPVPLEPVRAGGDADPPGPGAGSGLRFGSAMALDRRAVAGLAVLLLFAVGYAVQHFWLARPQAVAVPALASAPVSPVSPGAEGAEGAASASVSTPALGPGPAAVSAADPVGPGGGAVVVVDIGGRVHLAGLHTLPGGSRVADALRAAGGPLPETDTRSLNLARVLTDGEQILVGEPAQASAPGAGAGNGPPAVGTPRPPVSLNRAGLEQLDTLPGVGPTLAQRILAYRTSHGSFRTLDQLRQVSGIGARTFAELRPLLTL
ncbi:ComEA family DNA-binding protein [Kitasatospora sp. NPDC059811]|uniref:ComEA family DNA-binding protein n=1 Tax=Streptomycetaceae TaxID=2062 RepID=UPI000B1EE9A6|nr:helix-hairpin-helix domain-containing protein [Streptomyces sp. MJM8645]